MGEQQVLKGVAYWSSGSSYLCTVQGSWLSCPNAAARQVFTWLGVQKFSLTSVFIPCLCYFSSFNCIKMEFKVRKESETLLEKMFSAHSRSGQIKSDLMPALLRELSGELSVNGTEIQSQIAGPEYQDAVDYDTFQRIMLHFLVKKAKKESNEFAHKNVIGLTDFETP